MKLTPDNNKKIFFTADTHYSHKNICRGVTEWKEEGRQGNHSTQSTRDFKDLEEMNYALIKGINDYVGVNDELWHLGDWSFGGFENIKKFKDRLVCQNIHLVYGNHDHHIENNRQGMQGIFKTVQYVKTLSVYGHRIFLSHYGHRVWDKSHHGAIHLYGHSHNTLPPLGKSMDVGVDVAFDQFGEYRPFSWNEIQTIMSRREPIVVDHHNSQTT